MILFGALTIGFILGILNKGNKQKRGGGGGLHHVIELFVFVEFAFLFGGGILVLLVFRYEVVHVGLGFSELHLVHAFTGVPVKEGLAAEHASELLRHALEHLLDGPM